MTLAADAITQNSAVLQGQIISGLFSEDALGFAFSDQPINGSDSFLSNEVQLIGPADEFGTIDEETGLYTLDLSLAADEEFYRDIATLSCDTSYYYLAIGFGEVGQLESLVLADNEISFTTLPCSEEPEPEPEPIRRKVSGGSASSAYFKNLGITLNPTSSTTATSSKSSDDNKLCSADQIITQNLRAPSRNGIAGPLTDGAIKRMQTFLGTKADGFVGPITRGLLNNSCGVEGLSN